MQRVFSQIFSLPKSTLCKYFSDDFNLDPRIRPTNLLTQLESRRNLKTIVKTMNKKQKSGLRVLKKLTVIHLCLIYSPSLCEPFRKIDFRNLSENQWLNENIIKPYAQFVNKICFSLQLYKDITTDQIVNFTFDNLFFAIKLLKDLLECAKKISSLFHYYKKDANQRFPFLTDNYVYLIAYHAEKIYAIFKAILMEFIRFPKKYIVDQETEQILKYIMEVQVIKINEDMISLFLNSNFFPFGKGYGVKLFRVQHLPDQTRDYAQSILYAERMKAKKIKKKVTLDTILFDKTGKLNPEIYHGLQQITLGEQGIQRFQSTLQSKLVVPARRRDYTENIQTI